MDTAKLFTNGNSQAVRLPKAYRLKGKEAYITQVGDAIIILPYKKKWDMLLQSLDKFSADYMLGREQPVLERRDEAFL